MMRVSEIQIVGEGFEIETKTDAFRVIRNDDRRCDYILEFGDVEVVWDDTYRVWRVPAHSEQIANYVAEKAEHCARWGSN